MFSSTQPTWGLPTSEQPEPLTDNLPPLCNKFNSGIKYLMRRFDINKMFTSTVSSNDVNRIVCYIEWAGVSVKTRDNIIRILESHFMRTDTDRAKGAVRIALLET